MDINFTFSDTIAGYITEFNQDERTFSLKTSDNRVFKASIADNCYARYPRNLNEGYQDATPDMFTLLALPRQMVFAYGTFYPLNESSQPFFQAQWLVFP